MIIFLHFISWLAAQEDKHDFILYEADYKLTK